MGDIRHSFEVIEQMFEYGEDNFELLYEGYVQRARFYLRTRKPKLALVDINEVISIKPNSVYLLLLRCKIYEKLGYFDLAIQDVESAIHIDGRKPFLLLSKAILLAGSRRFIEAQAIVEPLLSQAESIGYASLCAAEICLKKEAYEDALLFLKEAKRAGENSLTIWQKEIFCYRALNKYKKTIKLCNEALLQNPNDLEILTALCRTYYEIENYEECERICAPAYRLFDTDYELITLLANCYRQLKDFEKSESLISHLLSLTPDYLPILLAKVDLLLDQNREGEALEPLLTICQKAPSESRLLQCAYLAQECEQDTTAIEMFSETYHTFANLHALRERVKIYIKNHRLTEARQDLLLLLKKEFQDSSVYIDLSRIDLAFSEYDSALFHVNQALYLDQKSEEAHFLKAKIFQKRGDNEGAYNYLVENKSLFRNDAFYYFERYRICKKISDTTKAFKDLTTALRLDPNNEEYHLALAHHYYQTQNWKNFFLEIDDCIEADPTSFFSYACRAMAKMSQNRVNDALIDFDQALFLLPGTNPIKAKILLARGIAYLSLELYHKAKIDILEANQLLPNEPEILYQQILLLEREEKLSQALQVCSQFLSEKEERDRHYLTFLVKEGNLLLKLGYAKRAISALNYAIGLNDSYSFSYYLKGCCLLKIGDKEGAGKNFRTAFHLHPEFKDYTHSKMVKEFLSS